MFNVQGEMVDFAETSRHGEGKASNFSLSVKLAKSSYTWFWVPETTRPQTTLASVHVYVFFIYK